jgi:uncharacterized MAPEG superfamily protein
VPIEVTILAFGAILLLVHIFAAANAKTKQYGVAWNMGPRDEAQPPLQAVPGRFVRAQTNFMETFPIAIIALLGVVVAGRTSQWTEIGGWIWLGARVVYLPLYVTGVRGLRSLAFLASLIGLGMVIWPICIP